MSQSIFVKDRTKSRVSKYLGGIKTAAIGKYERKQIFADNVVWLRCNRDKCNISIFNSWLKNIVLQVIDSKKVVWYTLFELKSKCTLLDLGGKYEYRK